MKYTSSPLTSIEPPQDLQLPCNKCKQDNIPGNFYSLKGRDWWPPNYHRFEEVKDIDLTIIFLCSSCHDSKTPLRGNFSIIAADDE